MKKMISILLAVMLVFTSSMVYAEDILSSIGIFFSNTASDVVSWADSVWKDASGWIDGAWGEASKWVSQAWDSSSTWVTDIWGDASTWVTESYNSAADSVEQWWINTFDAVTVNSKKAWSWIGETADSSSKETKQKFNEVRDLITAESTEQEIRNVFNGLTEKLELASEDVEKIWNSLVAYAKEKGISKENAIKLALPYLVKLNSDHESNPTKGIPGIAVAQYLTAIMEKIGVNGESAEAFLKELDTTLGVLQ